MKEYKVTYKTSYWVEAENEEEALEKANEALNQSIEDGFFCLDDYDIEEESEDKKWNLF